MKASILKNFNISEEDVLHELESDKDCYLIITHSFIYSINSRNKEPEISSIKVSSLDGYDISLKSKDPSQFYWSILGMICAVGFWQLSSDKIISAIGGISITLISILLALDYWFTPAKFELKIFSGSGIISTNIGKENLPRCKKILIELNKISLK